MLIRLITATTSAARGVLRRGLDPVLRDGALSVVRDRTLFLLVLGVSAARRDKRMSPRKTRHDACGPARDSEARHHRGGFGELRDRHVARPGRDSSVATRAARRRNAGEAVEVLSVLLTIEDGTKAPDIRQGISPPRFRVSPQDGNQR
ncbi:sorbitol/mannitol transport system permease protein [Streptomyces azureus]|uniref:Sorbitol/mannitol transport system permease protein n=1 Tax=Streptomyces azureus TaxID=146537 RepID=A0A0K8PT38_STRAJ|nr:sorbitol/mannitol transport system permease protein [Streptomyces azureus]